MASTGDGFAMTEDSIEIYGVSKPMSERSRVLYISQKSMGL